MGYQEAMGAAGAVVHAYEAFGSYQGEWYAKVTFQGVTGFVSGYYGSCSGCDSFQGEFGYSDEYCTEHQYDYPKPDACADCDTAKVAHQEKLAAFGRKYLDEVMDLDAALKQAGKHSDWDMEAEEMVKWLKANQ